MSLIRGEHALRDSHYSRGVIVLVHQALRDLLQLYELPPPFYQTSTEYNANKYFAFVSTYGIPLTTVVSRALQELQTNKQGNLDLQTDGVPKSAVHGAPRLSTHHNVRQDTTETTLMTSFKLESLGS